MVVSHLHIRIIAGAILLGGVVVILSLPAVAEPGLESLRIAQVEADVRLLTSHITRLQERIKALEARAAAVVPAPTSGVATAPATLSADAEEVLRLAAKDAYGQIHVWEGNALAEPKARRSPSAMPHLRTDEHEFCLDGTPRSFARWRAALQALVQANYVELAQSEGQRATYRVTQTGYAMADRLPSVPQTQQ